MHSHDGRTYVTGNRCDRGAGDMIQEKHKPVPNMVDVKLRRYFDYYLKKNISEFEGKLRIGIPRVLNMYEDFHSGLHSLINWAAKWYCQIIRRRINIIKQLIRFLPIQRVILLRLFMVIFVILRMHK